ncbi:metal-dependent transcriptional regulator [Thermohalobacter berrensis]|uniref:DNA-binding protein n=1 Tax=Thermohalobacter berrensis TaxID=99594 RepID=A0A419T9P7_9FIRM|nr:iron dependent repressor, metal binding and dimerization domain protein [Thermohalobacter berrensis]RKD34186.1 DNA-binding protein [Thermohalobacter berrensis]
MLSPSLEDYLEEVYRLSLNNKEIRIKDIADCLQVSMPSVVKGLKRLHNQGYIVYRPYQRIEVLDKGKKKGKFLIERNKILREFVKIIGSDCDIKQEAEAMEHYFSVSTIKAIEKLVKFLKERDDVLNDFKSFKIQSIIDDNIST